MASRPLSNLEKLAVEAAISAPLKQGEFSVSAQVSWHIIKDMRTELEVIGIDWREIRAKMVEIKKARRGKAA